MTAPPPDHEPTTEFPPAFLPSNPPPYPPPPVEPVPDRVSRGRRGALIAAVAVIAIGVGVLIGFAVADGGSTKSSAHPPGAPASVNPGSPVTGSPSAAANGKKKMKKKAKQGRVTRGTITAESGSTWTLKSQAGDTVDVTIGTSTKFGTKKAPARESDFPVGKVVAVVGPDASGKVTAVRVRAVPN